MKTIDFLPERYRQRTMLRRARSWWGICAAIFGAVIVISSGSQGFFHRAVKNQLRDLEPVSRIAEEQDQRFAALRRDVLKKEETAALYAYLRHPWPRSRIIGALVEQVPEGIELTSFHCFIEQKGAEQEAVAPRLRAVAKKEEAKKLPPRQQDQADLRESLDAALTVVDVRGSTVDDAQLHAYVQALAEHPLFVAAQLVSLNSAETPGTDRKSVFVVRVQVSPGYGQPGGPEVTHKPAAQPAKGQQAEIPADAPASAAVEPAGAKVKS